MQMSVDKKRQPDFGVRGRKQAEPTERKATVVQRLKKMSARWWGTRGPQAKKSYNAKGFKRARP